MREKLRSSKGMTLTEVIVALMIVGLIGVSLTVGVNGAVKVYRDSTRLYEAETLCGTILTYLEDEFRFGRNIAQAGGSVTFDSQAFGNGVEVLVDDNGKVLIGKDVGSGFGLLGDTAYTSGLKVVKDDCEFSYNKDENWVEIKIAVGSSKTDGSSGSDTYVTYVAHTVKVAPVDN